MPFPVMRRMAKVAAMVLFFSLLARLVYSELDSSSSSSSSSSLSSTSLQLSDPLPSVDGIPEFFAAAKADAAVVVVDDAGVGHPSEDHSRRRLLDREDGDDSSSGGDRRGDESMNVFSTGKSARHMTFCAKFAETDHTPVDLAPRRASLATLPSIAGVGSIRSAVGASSSSSLSSTSSLYGAAGGSASCSSGSAAGYSCDGVDLLSFLPLRDLNSVFGGSANANDVWGWTHVGTGREFALIGLETGVAFVEITDPTEPIYLGGVRGSYGDTSYWRDIKVYKDHAFMVSEVPRHGMHVFDLTRLLNVRGAQQFSYDAWYREFGNSHNIAMDEDSGYAYAVGTDTCSGGLHMIDVRSPKSPRFAGCYSGDGYTHDVQCVRYAGPTSNLVGRQICFACNEDTVTIVDVTSKNSPTQIAKFSGYKDEYTHQGWLTEDQNYFLFGDEGDEVSQGVNTMTYVLDVRNVYSPTLIGTHTHGTRAIDHNQYVRGKYTFQANYDSGLRIMDLSDVSNGRMRQVGYFDIVPNSDSSKFNGAWSVYPYFPSGTVVVSGTEQGLYVLSPDVLKGSSLQQWGGGSESLLYRDFFQYDGFGLSAAQTVTRVRAPDNLNGGDRNQWVGRIVIPPGGSGPKRAAPSMDRDDWIYVPDGATEIVLSGQFGLALEKVGMIRVMVAALFDTGDIVRGGQMPLGEMAHIRYATYEVTVSVPKGATRVKKVIVKVENLDGSAPRQVMYIKNVEVRRA